MTVIFKEITGTIGIPYVRSVAYDVAKDQWIITTDDNEWILKGKILNIDNDED